MKKIKVLLAQTWEMAQTLTPKATVEAEYGKNVLQGTEVTLAHHVDEYRDQPAPCNAIVSPLYEGEIVVSHLDLDTIGGVMALMGIKPDNADFWTGAEFIDLNGPHHVHKLSHDVKLKLEAYWAWNSMQPRTPRITEIINVTESVMKHAEIITMIISGDENLLVEGEKWAKETADKVESCLIEEDESVRVFCTDDVFTAASYFSPNLGVIASVTVNYNTKFGSITVATSDNSIVCRDVVQELFGPEAGGHAGIAGSPRGIRMTLADFNRTVQKIKEILNQE